MLSVEFIVIILIIFGVILGLGSVICLARPARPAADPPGETSGPPAAGEDWGAWRVALGSGDGHDYLKLSDADRTALCRKAAEDLGKDDRHARTYRAFLDAFYRGPDPNARGWRIAETIGVCQVSIDNGTIRLE